MKLRDQNGREWRVDTVTATSPSGESRIFSSGFTIVDDIAEYACKHPVHQPSYATASDIEHLEQEMRKNAIDTHQHMLAIRELFARVHELESKSNHRNL